jgi:hypothetical protein
VIQRLFTSGLSWVALSLLVSTSASAQNQVLPVGGLTYNAADCGRTTADEIQFDIDGLAGSYFWSLQLTEPQVQTGNDCPRYGDAAPANIIVPFGDAELAANGRFQHLASYTPGEILGDVCGTTRRRQNFPLCIYFSSSTATPMGAIDIDATSLALTIATDTLRPAQPGVSVSAGDGSLAVTVTEPDSSLGDVYTYEAQYRACNDLSSNTDAGTATATDAGTVDDDDSVCDAPGPFVVDTFTSPTFSLTGLVVGEAYEVRVVVIDDFGNRSDVSSAVTGTPQSELGPLDLYDGEDNLLSVPGPDYEACNEGVSGSTLSVLGVGLWTLGRRRRRRQRQDGRQSSGARRRRLPTLLTLALLGAFVAMFSLPAAAYPGQLTLGFKGGPYTPAIDSEVVGGSRIYPIYDCFFAKDGLFPNGILPQPAVDIDVHIFDMFGSLELGVGLAFTQARGTAVPVGAIGASELSTRTCPNETGTEGVELTIAMAKPQLTYRLDQLNDYFGIPFVPYARVGLVSAVYAFTENGKFDNDGVSVGRNPLGVRFGAEASVGMMLALDWFDVRDLWDKWNYALSSFKTRQLRAGQVHQEEGPAHHHPGAHLCVRRGHHLADQHLRDARSDPLTHRQGVRDQPAVDFSGRDGRRALLSVVEREGRCARAPSTGRLPVCCSRPPCVAGSSRWWRSRSRPATSPPTTTTRPSPRR